MPPRIVRLEGPIVDQIAAGEVVERPASVVKELLENALDAGATNITLVLEDGGRKRIELVDDGHGMVRADALLAIERHATSKLRTLDDLARVATLGFRGEALPSIASVARVRLVTRTEADEAATEVVVDAGVVQSTREVGAARGTRIVVEDLFHAVPARLKFLKSKPTEAGAVYDVVFRAALAHPELRIVVLHDGRKVHGYTPARDLGARARELLDQHPLQAYEGSFEGGRFEAYLASPEHARSGARQLHVFVNGRPVADVKLARAVAFAFGSVLPPGRYPTGVVHLDVPLDEVDVNAHPQKSEVRFARGAAFFEAFTRALARKVGARAFGGPESRGRDYWEARLSPLPADTRELAAVRDAPSPPGLVGFLDALRTDGLAQAVVGAPSSDEPISAPEAYGAGAAYARTTSAATTSSTSSFGALRVLGQARRTFIVCESDEGLVVLDQHAVDERIVYHRMQASRRGRGVESQRLLFPERVDVSHVEADFLESRADALGEFGLECVRLGPATVAVHTVPRLLARARPSVLVSDVLAELRREGERAFGDALDTAVATMACHAAIRAGDTLSVPECVALLRSLDEVDAFSGHCPHGRPVVTTLPWSELERKLGR